MLKIQNITFADHAFQPQNCGALLWEQEKILIVSDLHFEKGSSFLKFGTYLPPFDTQETLEKLTTTLNAHKVETIIFLGDVYHDTGALSRMNVKTRDIWQNILNNHHIVWVEGNHDPNTAPKGIECLKEHNHQDIIFRHIAQNNAQDFEISGHYHPAVTFTYKGQKLRKPCFIKSKNKMILPAYGTYTGGLDITDKIYKDIFNPYKPDEIFALGHHSVHKIDQTNTS